MSGVPGSRASTLEAQMAVPASLVSLTHCTRSRSASFSHLPTALQGTCICVSVHDAQLMPSGCTDTPRPVLWTSSPADGRLDCPIDTKGPQVPSACEWGHSCCRGQVGWSPHQGCRSRSSGQSRGDCGGAQPCSPAGRAPGSRGREMGQGQWSLGREWQE